MITGLQIDVTSAELKKMLEDRLKYHQEKVVMLQKQRDDMAVVEKSLAEERERIGKGGSRSLLEGVESSLRDHQNQVIYYKFMFEHVIPSETYRLQEADLIRLGIGNRSW